VTGLSATRACSGGRDAALLVWDLTAQSVEDRRAKAGNVISCLETLQNGTLVAQGAEDLAVRFWDLRQPGAEPVQSVRGFSHSPLSVAVHPRDEHYVLTACKASNGFGGEARVLDRRKGEVVHCFPGHKADATGCAWVTDCSFVTASIDGTIRLWSVNSATELPGELDTYHDADKSSFTCLDGDGDTFWVGTKQGCVKHFDVTANRLTCLNSFGVTNSLKPRSQVVETVPSTVRT